MWDPNLYLGAETVGDRGQSIAVEFCSRMVGCYNPIYSLGGMLDGPELVLPRVHQLDRAGPVGRVAGSVESGHLEALTSVGVDTSGTFTDFLALIDGRLHTAKVLSTPDDPARAIAEGLDSAADLDGDESSGSEFRSARQQVNNR